MTTERMTIYRNEIAIINTFFEINTDVHGISPLPRAPASGKKCRLTCLNDITRSVQGNGVTADGEMTADAL